MEAPFSLAALEFDKLKDTLSKYALTEMGRDRVSVLRPVLRKEDALAQLSITKEMHDCLATGDPLPIDGLSDPRPWLEKMHVAGQFFNTTELLKIRRFLEVTRRIKVFFNSRRETCPLIGQQTAALVAMPTEEKRIGEIVGDEGEILDSASPELRRIRRELESTSHQLRKKIETLARSYVSQGYAHEALVTVRDGRMVIPVKDEYKNTIRGFVHDASASGQTVYIEPTEALELNNAVRTLQYREVREIERILLEISNQLRERHDALTGNAEVMAEFDFAYAKGRLAQVLHGIVPVVRDDGVLILRRGQHPLLLLKELARPERERRPVVPLDFELGRPDRLVIISGPNAGGKTVALKTIGLFVLMTQCGLLIPSAEDSEVSVFHRVLADIGDEQSIENDLSTFSSHVKNLASMTRTVDPLTLILIDELGSGTDPREGAALSVAFLNHVLACKAAGVVTTHHGELKVYAHETPGVTNGSMEFDRATLAPTYVYRPGIPGSSYAFEIARRMGLDERLIEEARHVAGQESLKLDNLINDLQQRLIRHEQMVQELSREKSRLEGLSKFYDVRARELKQKEQKARKELLAEREKILRQANRDIEEWIRRIRESQADSATIQSSREFLKRTRTEIQTVESEIEKSSEPVEEFHPKPGDRVSIRGMDVEGTVLSEPDRHRQVTVAAGSLQIKVSVSQLRPAPAAVKAVGVKEKIDWDSAAVGHEIDLRGLTAEEALYETDKYISDAHALGLQRVSLIHGKGEGILRRKINEFLKKNPRVENFRLGQWGEGDTGVTIVELKGD